MRGQHTFKHGGAVDRWQAIADHRLRLVQSTLFIAKLRNQAGGECGSRGLPADLLFGSSQRIKIVALGDAEAQLLELSEALKAKSIHVRQKIACIVLNRVGYPWDGVEGFQVAGLPVPEPNDVRGDIRMPGSGAARLDAGLGQSQRSAAIVLQSDNDRPDRL